ncbi:MAG TPA: hypothetical protein VF158_07500 [Longimicrobiales bacterium]
MLRRLLAIRRCVPLDRSEEYDGLWSRVRAAVDEAGGHAWRFRSARRQDTYLEFIESRELDRVLEGRRVAAARLDLDAVFGPGDPEAWEEAPVE